MLQFVTNIIKGWGEYDDELDKEGNVVANDDNDDDDIATEDGKEEVEENNVPLYGNAHRSFWVNKFDLRDGRKGFHCVGKCSGTKQRWCKYCTNKTRYMCNKCGVALCIDNTTQKSCFEIFHTEEVLKDLEQLKLL
jgi:hypothetical protein